MKSMKQIVALLLILCSLIGLPLSVQAIGSSAPDSFRILKVVEMPDSMATAFGTSTYPGNTIKGKTVLVYFNSTMSAEMKEKLPSMVYRIHGQDKNGNMVSSLDATLYYVSGTNPIALYTPARTIDAWREYNADATSIHVALSEGTWVDGKATSATANKKSDVYVNESGQYLDYYADDVSYCTAYGDAVRSMAIEQETDMLTMIAAEKTSSTTINAYFSEPIAVNPGDFNKKYTAYLSIMDANNNLIRSNTGSHDGSVNTENTTTGKMAYQWEMQSMDLSTDGRTMTLTTLASRISNAFHMWTALTTNYPDAGYSLKLRIEEISRDAALGEVASNYFIDAIWGKMTNNPLYVNCASKDRAIVELAGGAAVGEVSYDTLAQALAAAESGDTVTLLGDAVVLDSVFVLDANVVLDLSGYALTVNHVMAFGHIVDSTEGEGKLIVDRSSRVILLPENQTLPLYDTDGYRFFTYRLTSVGTKTNAADLSQVMYGMKLHFDSMCAYELLADDANTDVALTMDIAVGGNNFEYTFTPNIFDTLYQKVKGTDFSERNKFAVTLTVSGLDHEDPDFLMKASPALYTACNTVSLGKSVAYEGYDDSYTRANAWIEEQIENDALFSFDYDGVAYAEHITTWEKTVSKTDAGWTVTYQNGDVVAWSEIFLDVETASVEWTNYFRNDGSSASPVIEDILAIDSSVDITDPTLTTTSGSTAEITDFQPISVKLDTEGSYSMATADGRSSSGAWPYFDISNGEYGIMGAIGWTGNWKADFVHHEGAIGITAGMQETKISLYAGEQMRTPMIMLQFFKGDQDDGHNAFRQLILKSYTPADSSGKPITHAPYAIGATYEVGEGEAALLEYAERVEDCKYEIFWMDAGWYGDLVNARAENTWGNQVGNWYFVPSIYTNGNVRELRQYLEERDAGLLLWFEPERVKDGTELADANPEWMLKDALVSSSQTYLYDFSNDQACDYMIEMISSIIQENDLTWYRQDLNVSPAPYWDVKNLEALFANRTGMAEIKYITNLYRYLDALVERNPGLMIDNCAAGGRRLDLEMMKRSVPLWNSDYGNKKPNADTGETGSTPDGIRSVNYNLSWWLPIHAGAWPWHNIDNTSMTYRFRVNMNSGIGLTAPIATQQTVKELLEQYFVCRELMNGDYYILASGKDDGIETEDACYEFYKEEEGKGYLVAFRPANCTTESETYTLKGLDASSTYKLDLVDSGETLTFTGQELMEDGLPIHYPGANSALLIYINKI